MKEWIKNQVDEIGIGGIVAAVIMLGACAYTAIWLAEPFIGGIAGIPSFIFLSMLYILILSLVLMPVIMVAGFVGNVIGFTVEGIIALYRYYKRV